MKNFSSSSSSLQDDYKQFLLVKLTEAAQNLVHDKANELLQVDFCRRVEMIMFYGIKSRPFKWRTESQDVWELLKTISPKHITEDIIQLSSVKTDTGRIRAWIRITINECSLQSFIPLLADQKINKKFYEGCTIFNDPDIVTRLIEQICPTSGCKVVFNPESFDFEVAPSATDLTQYSSLHYSRKEGNSFLEVSKRGSINDATYSDSIQSEETFDSSLIRSNDSSESNREESNIISSRESVLISDSDSFNSGKSSNSNQIILNDVSELKDSSNVPCSSRIEADKTSYTECSYPGETTHLNQIIPDCMSDLNQEQLYSASVTSIEECNNISDKLPDENKSESNNIPMNSHKSMHDSASYYPCEKKCRVSDNLNSDGNSPDQVTEPSISINHKQTIHSDPVPTTLIVPIIPDNIIQGSCDLALDISETPRYPLLTTNPEYPAEHTSPTEHMTTSETFETSQCPVQYKNVTSPEDACTEVLVSEKHVPVDVAVLPELSQESLPSFTEQSAENTPVVSASVKQDLALQLLDSAEQIDLSSSCLQLKDSLDTVSTSPPPHLLAASPLVQTQTEESATPPPHLLAASPLVQTQTEESATQIGSYFTPNYSVNSDNEDGDDIDISYTDNPAPSINDNRHNLENPDTNFHQMSNDILPSTLKDVLVEDEEICALRHKLGNSLHASQECGIEMLAHKVEELDDPFDDDDDDVSSAVSLSSSSSHCSESNSGDNLLQLIEPEESKEVGSVPVPTITRDPEQPQAHSLGSSLYKLFIRGSPTSEPKSERLSNLAALHSAVTDEVPISQEEDISTRSYLMGATRATVSYTYESANQWLSHSKDMWWWLQKRVITEHECQHPTPPTSDTIRSGSPNSSSLLDLCTEQCPCCNAIVIDFCHKDIQDPNTIPISKSCPPFSSITQHMNSPISPVAFRTKSVSDSKDYYNIDILQNPSPSVASLNEAIEVQKNRTQNTVIEEEKKKEMDVLVQLRKKKYDLQSSDSSSSEDNSINILGHSLFKSCELSGYCAKCGGAIYKRIKAAYSCGACNIFLHKGCLNDVARKCSLANREELLLETRLTPAHGLHEQNYCCFDCGLEISYNASKVNMCDYSGRYYCQDCHKKTMHIIPARILHNWDFKTRPVALQSYEVISYLTNKQYLNIEQLNPELFNFVELLREIRSLREQIILYKAHFVQCSRAMKEGMFLKLKSRQHFVDTSKLYTLHDLVDVHSGGLLGELTGVVEEYRAHQEDCETCSHQKFVCAVCSAPPAIRPFTDCFNIAQCFTCHGVMHRECFNRSTNCPYCDSSLICEI